MGGCNAKTEISNQKESETLDAEPAEFVDYAASVTLNMVSDSAKEEVTVKTVIDGDESVLCFGLKSVILKEKFGITD